MIKRLAWLRGGKKTDRTPPLRLPIAAPAIADPRRRRLIHELVFARAQTAARRHNVDRREFLASSCGLATTLFVTNLIDGCVAATELGPGNRADVAWGPSAPVAGTPDAGGFAIPEAACDDPDLADALLRLGHALGGDELIVDMQTYFATPETGSSFQALGAFIGAITQEQFPWIVRTPGLVGSTRYDRAEYVDQVLMGSTTLAVLSGIPYAVGDDGTGSRGFAVLQNEDLLGGADYLNGMFDGRVLKQCTVIPNDRIDVQLAMMERNAGQYHHWKTVPAYQGPARMGYWLHEGVGPRMLEKGLALGRPIFCIEKGRTLPGFGAEYGSPQDIGPAARMFPDARLVVSQAGFEAGLHADESSRPMGIGSYTGCGDVQREPGAWPEGPYDEEDPAVLAAYPLDRGVNALIRSLRRHNIGPNGRDLDNPDGPVTTHVYAEVGQAWPQLMTDRREEAIHFWGKLLKHVGEDRILWGTGSLWFGSPEPIIQAFGCFEIPEDFQGYYGYPALTPERKRKILGLNAARLQAVLDNVDVHACHSEHVNTAQRELRRDLDDEFGPRRDMIAEVPGVRMTTRRG